MMTYRALVAVGNGNGLAGLFLKVFRSLESLR